ncbi:methyltransferase domain-containing protein [Saccharopolyspora rosea]|uniref:Methyltransferase domain-containing protein n=1 Tax=Saccharopolyspora rosea TaxID=524884 RepID=A0ABW3G119_9PSEU|nr:class I SAM-dependent methyltransferase [Saccharopolyspora rosea]
MYEGSGERTRNAVRLRAELLGPSRTRPLTAVEVDEVGRVLYGGPERFGLYGIPAPEMSRRGLRLLGRMVVECAPDSHCRAFADAVAGHVADGALVLDLFCGTGNCAYHLARRLGRRVFAAETDPDVYRATRHNLAVAGADVDLRPVDYRELMTALPPRGSHDLYLLDPPWGSAAGDDGLDLTATDPPVPEVLGALRRARDGSPALVVVKTPGRIAHDSLATAFRDAHHLASVAAVDPPHPGRSDFHLFRLD